VNTLLLTLELKGDADLMSDCVFWTTLISSVTVTIALAVATRKHPRQLVGFFKGRRGPLGEDPANPAGKAR
jgi:hypothetical protein